ncbi:thioredoxin family protein [Halobacterium yunchengense]|uniref:thioredoxin family protein n=1 Tax=Halobacterium yunchengense TaxID=3108497 RepID=UPI00300A0F41
MTDDTIEEIKARKKAELVERAQRPDEPDQPVEIEGSEHFEDVLASHDTVLADFYADWCGPCQMMAPAVERLAADDGVVVAKVDVDAHQGLAQAWGVQGMPTLVVFEGGSEVDRAVGARSYDGLCSLVA